MKRAVGAMKSLASRCTGRSYLQSGKGKDVEQAGISPKTPSQTHGYVGMNESL